MAGITLGKTVLDPDGKYSNLRKGLTNYWL